jgi:predicted phage gp36 major capsid-like protein
VASGAAGAFASASPVDKLIDLIYAPKAQYRPNGRFVMNRRTVSAVRKFKDADGNYVWSPAMRLGETASLLGYPVTEIETMPDVAANSLSIAFGDFARGYLIVDRAGGAGAARSLFGQALCAVLHDQACRRRGAELRRDQADEVRGLVRAANESPLPLLEREGPAA